MAFIFSLPPYFMFFFKKKLVEWTILIENEWKNTEGQNHKGPYCWINESLENKERLEKK